MNSNMLYKLLLVSLGQFILSPLIRARKLDLQEPWSIFQTLSSCFEMSLSGEVIVHRAGPQASCYVAHYIFGLSTSTTPGRDFSRHDCIWTVTKAEGGLDFIHLYSMIRGVSIKPFNTLECFKRRSSP